MKMAWSNRILHFYYRHYLNKTGSLIIHEVEYSDSGEYKAVADNGAGVVDASARLHIYFGELI